MDVTTTWQGKVVVANLAGELHMRNHEDLAEDFHRLAREDASGIVLNFKDVVYIASVGIGLLLNLAKMAREKGMGVRLAAVPAQVRMIMEIVCLDKTIPIDGSVEEAMERVAVAV
ncbi:MAG TPA: STAS domain-containing protein [Phycisphaerae bacterium]|jgi:anti-anti-sigma factor